MFGTKPSWILSGVGIILLSDLLETPAPNYSCNELSDKILDINLRGARFNFNK